MAINENNIVPEISFPKKPDNIDEEMRMYLNELERVLREALRGTLLLERTFQDGLFGN